MDTSGRNDYVTLSRHGRSPTKEFAILGDVKTSISPA